jgi:hypothetical protein
VVEAWFPKRRFLLVKKIAPRGGLNGPPPAEMTYFFAYFFASGGLKWRGEGSDLFFFEGEGNDLFFLPPAA